MVTYLQALLMQQMRQEYLLQLQQQLSFTIAHQFPSLDPEGQQQLLAANMERLVTQQQQQQQQLLMANRHADPLKLLLVSIYCTPCI